MIQKGNLTIRELNLSRRAISHYDKNLELNLDTLQLFLDYFFPNKHKSIKRTHATT